MDTVSSPAPLYQQGLFQWLLLLKHSTCVYQKKSNNIFLCHSVTDAYFEVNSDFFLRNLIIQVYYHQELCKDAVVLLTNKKQPMHNSALCNTSICKVKMNAAFNITSPKLLS